MFKVRGLILSFICVLCLPGFVSAVKQEQSSGLSRQMKRLHEYERLQSVLEESNPELCEQFVRLSEKSMTRAKLAAQDKKAIGAFLDKVEADLNLNQRDKKSIAQFLRPGLSTGAKVGIGVGSAAAVIAALATLAIKQGKGSVLLNGFSLGDIRDDIMNGSGLNFFSDNNLEVPGGRLGAGAGAGVVGVHAGAADDAAAVFIAGASTRTEDSVGEVRVPAGTAADEGGPAGAGAGPGLDEGSLAGAGLGAEVVALDKRPRFIKMFLEFRRELQKLTINPTQTNQPDPYKPGEFISDFYREMAVCLGRYVRSFKFFSTQSLEDYLISCGYTVNLAIGGRGYFGNQALICKKDAKAVCVKVVISPVTSTLMAHRIVKLLPDVYSAYRRRIAKGRDAGAAEENSFIPVEPAYSYLVKVQDGKYVQLQESVTAGQGLFKRVPLLSMLTPDVIDQLILVESLIGTYDMHADNVGYVYRPDGTPVVKLFDLERIGYYGEVSDKKRAPSPKKYFIRLILGEYKNRYNKSHIKEIKARYQRAEKD